MIKPSRKLLLLLLVLGILGIVAWQFYMPLDRIIEVQSDFFVSPRGALLTTNNGNTFIRLGPTPSKHPPDADVVWKQLKRGNKVKARTEYSGQSLEFVFVGISEEDDFVIEAASEFQAHQLLQAFQFEQRK